MHGGPSGAIVCRVVVYLGTSVDVDKYLAECADCAVKNRGKDADTLCVLGYKR